MKQFKDLGIKPRKSLFIGDKIKISKLLNQEIIVHNYKIDKSKFSESNSDICLKLQVELKSEKYVLFTGSKFLSETIQQIPEEALPFQTVITKEGEAFQFN